MEDKWKEIPTNRNNNLFQNRIYTQVAVYEDYVLFFGNKHDFQANNTILLFDLQTLKWDLATPKGQSKLLKNHNYNIGVYQDDKLLFYGAICTSQLTHQPALKFINSQARKLQTNLPQSFTGCLEMLTVTKNESMNGEKSLNLEWGGFDTTGFSLPARQGHTINVYQGKAYIFAGLTESGEVDNTLFILSLGYKRYLDDLQIVPSDSNITARYGHSSALINGKIYYYGGFNKTDKSLNEISLLEIGSLQWKTCSPIKLASTVHGSRFVQSLGNTLYFLNVTKTSCDGWIFKIGEDTWENLKTKNKLSVSKTGNFLVSYQSRLIFGHDFELYELELGKKYQTKDCNKKGFYEADSDNTFHMTYDRRLFIKMPCPDITFNVEGKQIHAHKELLISKSSFFEKMFKSGMKESVNNVIEVPETKFETFYKWIEYIYCNKVSLNEEEAALDLLVLSDKYSLQHLRSICEEHLSKQLRKDNVISIANLAERYEAKNLKKTALRFLLDNSLEVFETQSVKDLSGSLIVDLIMQRY